MDEEEDYEIDFDDALPTSEIVEPPVHDRSNDLSEIMTYLSNAFATGRPAQGYIFNGPVRDEGTFLSKWIGRLLFPNEDDAVRIENGTHPDMHWIQPEKKSRIISVEVMNEQILRPALESALCGGWKIFVIMYADRMPPATANKFLKTLEEPPPKTLFILLSDNLADILPTISSRCQTIDIGSRHDLDEPYLSAVLNVLGDIEGHSPVAAMRRSAALSGVLSDLEDLSEATIKAASKANSEIDENADELAARIESRYREFRNDVLHTISRWMEDLLRLKAGGDEMPLNYEKYRAVLIERTKLYTLAQLMDNSKMLEDFVSQLSRNIPDSQLLPYWFDRFFI